MVAALLPQADILAYLRRCAEDFGVAGLIRFGTEVLAASFDEQAACWRLQTSTGEHVEADVLVCACGQLSQPQIPDLPGLERFRGKAFHSARWDHDHDLRGERVAVIGTGASAIQFVPAIAPVVNRLTVFARSQPWVIPKVDGAYGPLHRVQGRLPVLQRAKRLAFWSFYESLIPAFAGERSRVAAARHPVQAIVRALGLANLRLRVRDARLRARLAPTDAPGCKRILMSNDWYRAMSQPQVSVVDDPIAEVAEDGLVTARGEHHPADTIIFGTGFASHAFVAPMRITGAGGRDLADAWSGGASAHLGMTVPGFPSLFLLYGPNTNLGSGSEVFMLESQAAYVVDAVRLLHETGAASLDVRPEVHDAFDREVQERLAGSVWQAGCHSWYVDETGRNTNNWPGFTAEYRRRTRRIDPAEYRLAAPVAAGA